LAFGALDTSAATTLTLNRNNTGGYLSSLTNASHWTANAGGTATAPQLMDADVSPNPDAAGYDYYIPSGNNLRTFKIDATTSPYADKLITFGGRSLHVSGVFWPASAYEKFPLRIADLHFRDESKVNLSTSCGLTNSAITVEASANNPLKIYNSGNSGVDFALSLFDCSLTGNASANILVGGSGVKGHSTLFYKGDGSGFLGTITCETAGKTSTLQLGKGTDLSHATITLKATSGSSAATLSMDQGATISVGTLNLYNYGQTSNDKSTSTFGTVNVYGGGSLINKTAGGTMTIGTLNQSGGQTAFGANTRIQPQAFHVTGGKVVVGQLATVDVTTVNGSAGNVTFGFNYNTDEHRYGCANVTNSFAGPVTLLLDSVGMGEFYQGLSSAHTVVKIAKTAVSAAPTAADLPVAVPDSYGFMLENDLVRIEEDTDTWNVVLVPHSYIYLKQALSGSVPWASSSTNVWSDGRPPHSDADYLSRYQFYTYGNVSTTQCKFNMKSLTISASELWMAARNVTFPKVTLEAAALDSNLGALVGSSSCDIAASEIYVRDGTLGNMRPYGGATFNVYAPLTGGGIFQTLNRGTAKPSGVETNFGNSTLNLMQASPDFTGKIKTWKYANGTYPYSLEDSTKLGIAVPLALGGPLDTFMFDALELNLFGCLKPLASMTLDTANRGIFVNWFGRMLVESNLVFHVNERLTMGGTLEKMGAGTLWLGASAAPRFTGAQLADPPSAAGADGTNLVRVLEGALGATTTNAVDGLALFFAEGGKLAVDAATTGDVAAYGLYNKKGTVTFDGANLGVAISPPEDAGYATVAVLTVPTAQAAAFLDGTKPRMEADALKGYRTWFSYDEDAVAGLTTFKVTVARVGMTIIFR
jgi:hypothetical protein